MGPWVGEAREDAQMVSHALELNPYQTQIHHLDCAQSPLSILHKKGFGPSPHMEPKLHSLKLGDLGTSHSLSEPRSYL